MEPIGYHFRSRLEDGRVIAKTVEERRLVAGIVLRLARRHGLLAMALSGSHLHGEATCSRAEVGRLTHAIESSVRQRLRLPVGFVHYRPEPLRDQRHLENTFRYILTQPDRHGFDVALMDDGSNLPDLLGLRVVGRYTLKNVRQYLPGASRAQLLQWLGAPDLSTTDGPLERVEDATLAAANLSSLRGKGRETRCARRAMLEVIGQRVSRSRAAELLHIRPRTLRTLQRGEPDPELVTAIRLQLGLRLRRDA